MDTRRLILFGKRLGPELIVNGGFDADSDWTKGTGWAISGGVATFTGSTSGNLTQTISGGIVGANYRVTFTVPAFSSGSVNLRFGDASANDLNAAGPGDYQYIGILDSLSQIIFRGTTPFPADISIDSVSVRQIL